MARDLLVKARLAKASDIKQEYKYKRKKGGKRARWLCCRLLDSFASSASLRLAGVEKIDTEIP